MLAEAKHLPVASAKRLVTRVQLTLAYRIQVYLLPTVKLWNSNYCPVGRLCPSSQSPLNVIMLMNMGEAIGENRKCPARGHGDVNESD